THDVVAYDRPARVADAEKVPAVARRGDTRRARDRERDVLTTVLVLLQLWHHLDVHRQLADAFADAVEQRGIDMLGRGRCVVVILDADEQCAARAVREADAVLRELAEV